MNPFADVKKCGYLASKMPVAAELSDPRGDGELRLQKRNC
jgi:hypothetical protein